MAAHPHAAARPGGGPGGNRDNRGGGGGRDGQRGGPRKGGGGFGKGPARQERAETYETLKELERGEGFRIDKYVVAEKKSHKPVKTEYRLTREGLKADDGLPAPGRREGTPRPHHCRSLSPSRSRKSSRPWPKPIPKAKPQAEEPALEETAAEERAGRSRAGGKRTADEPAAEERGHR